MNTYDYSGKIAVVTGGANGIGAAVAERMVPLRGACGHLGHGYFSA